RLVDLFRRLSVEALQDFPDPVLNDIKNHANNVFNLFQQIVDFSPESGNPKQQRQQIINQLIAAYPGTFQGLHSFIAYSLHRAADFQRLDATARATLQSDEDRSKSFSEAMKKHEAEARRILDEIR